MVSGTYDSNLIEIGGIYDKEVPPPLPPLRPLIEIKIKIKTHINHSHV